MRFWKKRATHTTVAEQPDSTDIRILLAGQPVTGRMIGHWVSCNGVLTCRWQLET